MRTSLIVAIVLILTACADEPGTEKWCVAKKKQPKSEWSGADVRTFATKCVLKSTTIGSDKWCKKLSETPKGEWTADDAAAFAKHCVI